MTRSRYLRVAVAALGLLALLPPAARAADPPTLGGSLGASDAVVRVTSSATVPVSVDLDITEGWAVEVPSFVLAPGEARTVSVTERGEAEAVVTATLRAVEVVSGTEAAALVLATGVRPSPPDYGGLALWVVLAIASAVLVGSHLWRFRRAHRRPDHR